MQSLSHLSAHGIRHLLGTIATAGSVEKTGVTARLAMEPHMYVYMYVYVTYMLHRRRSSDGAASWELRQEELKRAMKRAVINVHAHGLYICT